jgi:hypothetical protein
MKGAWVSARGQFCRGCYLLNEASRQQWAQQMINKELHRSFSCTLQVLGVAEVDASGATATRHVKACRWINTSGLIVATLQRNGLER